jgi:PAS domain S-box-containing protein
LPQSSVTSTAPPRLRFHVPPEPSHLLRARDRIRDYLRHYCADEPTIDDVVLCIEEAAANAMRHSDTELDIELSLGFEGAHLVAEVRDHGHGFDVTTFDPEALPDLASDHGRGLFIISNLMDTLELRLDGGLEVRMTRRADSCVDPALLYSGLGEPHTAGTSRRREQRTQAMLDELGEGFLALDWEYRCVHANAEALRIGGIPFEDLAGRTPWEVYPALEGSPLQLQYREAMELGRPSVIEHCSVATGEWLEVRAYPTPAGISVYYRDIGERKRIEQEVLGSRAKLEATLAAITDGFYTLDRDWRVTYLNDQAAAVFPGGKEALGASFWELFPEAVGSEFELNKRAAMEEGEFRSYESYYPPFDTWFEERDYPSVEGITVLFADVSERKRAEKALRESEQHLRAVLETMTEGLTISDADGVVVHMNPEALRINGYNSLEQIRRPLADWPEVERLTLDGKSLPQAASALARVTRGETFVDYTYEVRNNDVGRDWIGSFSGAPIRDEAGKVVFTVLTVRDVTEQHRAEVEGRRLLEELAVREGLNAALGEIAATITGLLNSEDILESVVPRAGAAIGADSAVMCTLESQGWVPRHVWNVPDEVLDVAIPREQTTYANEAIETRTAVAIDDCETDPRVDLELQHAWGVRSVLTVPLVVRGEVAGSLFFNYHSRQHTFTKLEIDFASRAADLVSGVLESARLYGVQRRVAETLQENFIHEMPVVPGLEIGVVSGRAFASDLVGGDFSDVFALDDTHVVTLIADVAGKGVRAAGHTETVRAKVRSFATIDSSPAYILGKVNEVQLRFDPGDPHVTAFCAVLDPHTGHLTYASAGHPAPVHLGAFTCGQLDVTFGLPLGLFELPYTNGHAMLAIDDYLVLYTDGVTEARCKGELFGEPRLLAAVDGLRGRSAQAVAEGVRDAVVTYADGLRDDLQVIVLRLA